MMRPLKPSVDLLKIDCEGGEYEIILTTPNECYNRIGAIVYEWHKTPGWEANLAVTQIGQLEYATRTVNSKLPLGGPLRCARALDTKEG